MAEGVALYDLTYDQLSQLLASWGEPRFRSGQLWQWLYSTLADNFEAMSNLPVELRKRLSEQLQLKLLTAVSERTSLNGSTRKVLFRLRDGQTIESVLMSYRHRTTVCVSTQAGCALDCAFCATGQGGLTRSLSPGEIIAQVLFFARELRQAAIAGKTAAGTAPQVPAHPVSNVVLMGMGEPLANYASTWQAIETLADARGHNLGARRFTVSTVGLVPGIRRLAAEALPVNLAVSLHAAENALRDRLVPVNRRYPLDQLMAALHDYVKQTGRRVSIEYALIDGVNDSALQAQQLAGLLAGLLCHVNLIPLNPTPGSPFRASSRERVNLFREELMGAGVPATVRMRRGLDIEAGCGQLRQQEHTIAAH